MSQLLSFRQLLIDQPSLRGRSNLPYSLLEKLRPELRPELPISAESLEYNNSTPQTLFKLDITSLN